MRYVNVSQRVGRLLTLPAAVLLIAISTAQAQEIDTLALREFTSVLAHDTLEGRGTGTRGERMARSYIVSQLERIAEADGSPSTVEELEGALTGVPLPEWVPNDLP
jgi:hypothetical protein